MLARPASRGSREISLEKGNTALFGPDLGSGYFVFLVNFKFCGGGRGRREALHEDFRFVDRVFLRISWFFSRSFSSLFRGDFMQKVLTPFSRRKTGRREVPHVGQEVLHEVFRPPRLPGHGAHLLVLNSLGFATPFAVR